MGLLKEFREFAVKGNVIDLAVGIIIGAAFTGIVNSLVNDVIMPPIGAVVGSVDFSDLAITLVEAKEPKPPATPPATTSPAVPAPATPAAGADKAAPPVELRYGKFLQACFNFLIVAWAVFLLVKAINEARRRMERKAEQNPSAPEVPADVRLLTEIRDELRKRTA